MILTEATAPKRYQQILSESFLSHHVPNKLCWLIWKKGNHNFCLSWLFSVFNLLIISARIRLFSWLPSSHFSDHYFLLLTSTESNFFSVTHRFCYFLFEWQNVVLSIVLFLVLPSHFILPGWWLGIASCCFPTRFAVSKKLSFSPSLYGVVKILKVKEWHWIPVIGVPEKKGFCFSFYSCQAQERKKLYAEFISNFGYEVST